VPRGNRALFLAAEIPHAFPPDRPAETSQRIKTPNGESRDGSASAFGVEHEKNPPVEKELWGGGKDRRGGSGE